MNRVTLLIFEKFLDFLHGRVKFLLLCMLTLHGLVVNCCAFWACSTFIIVLFRTWPLFFNLAIRRLLLHLFQIGFSQFQNEFGYFQNEFRYFRLSSRVVMSHELSSNSSSENSKGATPLLNGALQRGQDDIL